MSTREQLYHSLVAELLGPRTTVDEIIEDDPRDEYVTGVLEPKSVKREGGLLDYGIPDISGFVPGNEGEEDSDEISDYFDTSPVSTTLHPLARPKTMGISFLISSKAKPVVDLCITWARYQSHGGKWKRKPLYQVYERFEIDNKNMEPMTTDVDNGILVVPRCIHLQDGKWHVSVYLVNDTKLQEEKYPKTHEMVFQPQIRINVDKDSHVEPLEFEKIEGEEEQQLAMLYSKLSAYARGHLCGAIWKDIDPARPFKSSELHSSLISSDILNLPEAYRTRFMLPDIRTDYLPSYTIDQSTVETKDLGSLKEDDLNTGIISERWDVDTLTKPLHMLGKMYEEWILARETEIAKTEISESQRITSQQNIKKCYESLNRIKSGLYLLETDEKVRLAFLFMNKVMDVQYQWYRNGAHLIWRPFQIAFILQCIEGIANRESSDRDICDLLWYPTGGGKTEAYVGLTIFCLALRRLNEGNTSGGGTGVISRYTLRLLTIQQFRRTLRAIVAADYLRVSDWSPRQQEPRGHGLWGEQRFSIGLWVGQPPTPNNMVSRRGWDDVRKAQIRYPGAVDVLQYNHTIPQAPGEIVSPLNPGEPAQVLKCPSCSSLLAIPSAGLAGSEHSIFWIIKSSSRPQIKPHQLNYPPFTVKQVQVLSQLPNQDYYILHVRFSTTEGSINDDKIREWWKKCVEPQAGGRLACSAASRPGYFIRQSSHVYHNAVDFEIRCPNPVCDLARTVWFEKVPSASGSSYLEPIAPFRSNTNKSYSHGVPISAYTVDAQIYTKCPSIIIATVDKFARLPFEPRSGALFGNVDSYDTIWGYGREGAMPDTADARRGEIIPIKRFDPPDLIIQDELHLIEGPLGSMVGLYECAVDVLSTAHGESRDTRPKYIASTATTRHASVQISSLFERTFAQFPPHGLSAMDNFFSRCKEGHPLSSEKPGRIYVGVCCPGKGPQTPVVRIWTSLLQEAERLRRNNKGIIDRELDYFWTVVGYFNAVRELAQAAKLYREDIPLRMQEPSKVANRRNIEDRLHLELSSNKDSSEIPSILEQLEREGSQTDAVFATSMFGTGVDIDRLSLMIVHGQPKTTSSYIQATGRVGRSKGALVVTFLRSTRPRDLDHYEFFTGYHRALYRYVEPVTVYPFSPRAFERALGPVAVALLRNSSYVAGVRVDPGWTEEDSLKRRKSTSGSRRMSSHRFDPEIGAIVKTLEGRAQKQIGSQRPPRGSIARYIESEFEDWENVSNIDINLLYSESTYNREAKHAVVLGDPQHRLSVFESTPQSMREVESTTRFRGR
jgi:hypothetical protein